MAYRGVIRKGELDHELERERQRVAVLLQLHQDRLAAVVEVQASIMQAEAFAISLTHLKFTPVTSEELTAPGGAGVGNQMGREA